MIQFFYIKPLRFISKAGLIWVIAISVHGNIPNNKLPN